jgi:hypothetical protein
MKRRRVKVGQVWHTKRGYRRIIAYYRSLHGQLTILYENRYGRSRRCLRTTFVRWLSKSGARNAQRKRRRDLALG